MNVVILIDAPVKSGEEKAQLLNSNFLYQGGCIPVSCLFDMQNKWTDIPSHDVFEVFYDIYIYSLYI